MSDAAAPPDGSVRFIEAFVPPMAAGEYRLTVTQEVELTQHGVHEAFVAQARLAVAGERFVLDPSEINSVFPPAGSQGDFFNVLPHILITRRTLPWERSAYAAGRGPAAGAATAPWLALLVFDQSDPAPAARPATVLDLVSASVHPGGKLPVGFASYPGLDALDFGETHADPCSIIDIPSRTFRAIAPTIQDLGWLAHGRRSSNARKSAPIGAPFAEAGEYATIVANRLPAMDRLTTVHLVSLEGMDLHLPDAAGAASHPEIAAVETVRLVSLWSWSFQAQLEKQSFSTCFGLLDCGLLRLAASNSRATAPVDRIVDEGLSRGFVPLAHLPRDGGSTVSWYRGPLSPCSVARTLQLPISSADAATRYDPETGMFDVSYAVAWQIGRLLALQDRPFSTGLYRWKIANRRDEATRQERLILARKLADPNAAADPRGATMGALKAVLAPQTASGPAGVAAPPAERSPPAVLVDWLARLRLLKGVPFSHLVADENLSPPESIRFFHVDPNWLDALVDGAFSVGRFTAGDLAHDDVQAPAVHAAAAAVAAAQRPQDADAASRAGDGVVTVTGFLLRSNAVAWWPGLEIHATAPDGTPVALLRVERLASTVLLCLFDGVIGEVVFSEAPEALHFGLDPVQSAGADLSHFLRRLRPLGTAPPAALQPLPVPMRGEQRVVQVARLAEAMRRALAATPFTAAEFALEMVEGVGRARFRADPIGVQKASSP